MLCRNDGGSEYEDEDEELLLAPVSSMFAMSRNILTHKCNVFKALNVRFLNEDWV